MALLIGAFLALGVGLLATASGLQRDRAFYPTVTIVIASYYALFAVMGAPPNAIVLESLAGAAFLGVAVAGFRSSLWIVVLALAAHGIFDLAHGRVIDNPGVPGVVAREPARSCGGLTTRCSSRRSSRRQTRTSQAKSQEIPHRGKE